MKAGGQDVSMKLCGFSAQLTVGTFNREDEEPVALKSTDIEMQLEFDSDFSGDATMAAEDESLHSKVVSEYGRDIIANLKKSESIMIGNLDKHEIKGSHRKQMVVWMEEVLRIFKCPTETFFMAVSLMDKYLEMSKTGLLLKDLHEIGITCMFIASKYVEVEPLTLDLMVDKVAHGKITVGKLLKREMKICSTLKFKLAKPTV